MVEISLSKPAIGEKCNGCGLCCVATVCSTGSFAMGLVENLGERAPGPCPALTPAGDGRHECGLVRRPKDWMPRNPHGVTPLKNAVLLLIGSGSGCDGAGPDEGDDDPAATAARRALGEAYAARIGKLAINQAAMVVFKNAKI